MTIRLGEAIVQGTGVRLKAPGQFGLFEAVRLTNYTADVLILNGIDSEDPADQQYLLPLQQNVYKTSNTSNIPEVIGMSLGGLTSVPTVLAEWSDNPLKDFPGTYPTAIGLGIATPAVTVAREATGFITAGVTYTLAGNPFRKRVTLFNAGDFETADFAPLPVVSGLEWSSADSGWGTNPVIAQGDSRVVETTAPLYFRALTGQVCSGHQTYLDYTEETYA
jgi:hypothetical protein